jgi:hypothetical protein
MRVSFAIALAALAALVGASGALSDGAPPIGEDAGLTGIETRTGFRYITISQNNRTVLARIGPKGRVVAARFLAGRYTIPGIAYDGTAAGLATNGKRLILTQPRWGSPRQRMSFLIVSTRELHTRAVTLHGDFMFDAISPDGTLLYFIEYLSKDSTRYAVRAYDVPSGRLLPEPVIDRSEPDEEMRGNPITRVMSPNGRWAYTLYDGAGMAPFVHALDTVAAEAHCIDLDILAGRRDLNSLRLRLGDDGTLAVVKGTQRLAVVDLATMRVSDSAPVPSGSGGVPWLPIAAAMGALLVAVAISLAVFRRRRLAPT